MSIMGEKYFEDFISFSYGPKDFGIHVLESMSGIDLALKGQYRENYSAQMWLVFSAFLSCNIIAFMTMFLIVAYAYEPDTQKSSSFCYFANFIETNVALNTDSISNNHAYNLT
jgi:hypothetical protein